MVGLDGFEPSTSRLSGARSNHLSYRPFLIWLRFVHLTLYLSSDPFRQIRLWVADLSSAGGDDGNRTHDPLLAGQVLSQLSYTPVSLRGELNNLYGHSKLNNNKLILAFRLTLSLAVFIFGFALQYTYDILSHHLRRISRSP